MPFYTNTKLQISLLFFCFVSKQDDDGGDIDLGHWKTPIWFHFNELFTETKCLKSNILIVRHEILTQPDR